MNSKQQDAAIEALEEKLTRLERRMSDSEEREPLRMRREFAIEERLKRIEAP